MKQFGLSKSERIKSKKEIQLLFNSGKTIYSNSLFTKAIFYFIDSDSETAVKLLVAAHSKSGNAVWRNRVKRIFREAFRLNKFILSDIPDHKLLLLALSTNKLNQKRFPKLSYNDLCDEIVELLNKITKFV